MITERARADELRAIEEAIAAGRMRRIDPSEIAEHNDERREAYVSDMRRRGNNGRIKRNHKRAKS